MGKIFEGADKDHDGFVDPFEFKICIRGSWLYLAGVSQKDTEKISAITYDNKEIDYDAVTSRDIKLPACQPSKEARKPSLPRHPTSKELTLPRIPSLSSDSVPSLQSDTTQPTLRKQVTLGTCLLSYGAPLSPRSP